jgi:hypothetical protein
VFVTPLGSTPQLSASLSGRTHLHVFSSHHPICKKARYHRPVICHYPGYLLPLILSFTLILSTSSFYEYDIPPLSFLDSHSIVFCHRCRSSICAVYPPLPAIYLCGLSTVARHLFVRSIHRCPSSICAVYPSLPVIYLSVRVRLSAAHSTPAYTLVGVPLFSFACMHFSFSPSHIIIIPLHLYFQFSSFIFPFTLHAIFLLELSVPAISLLE